MISKTNKIQIDYLNRFYVFIIAKYLCYNIAEINQSNPQHSLKLYLISTMDKSYRISIPRNCIAKYLIIIFYCCLLPLLEMSYALAMFMI